MAREPALITNSTIVIDADLARSSFVRGLKAATFIAGLGRPNSHRSLPLAGRSYF